MHGKNVSRGQPVQRVTGGYLDGMEGLYIFSIGRLLGSVFSMLTLSKSGSLM